MSSGAGSSVTGISIVCVFNDQDVLHHCLSRSVDDYVGDMDVDFVPVDNTGNAFTTAGAALNHGARNARHDVVVFAHQDVYLHSIERLTTLGSLFADSDWGVLGANGFTANGTSVGRIRDRVLLVGTSAPFPVEVDSLDEVLFAVRRDLLLENPLTEDPQLAWHAYAVEYGLRMRRIGKKVGAVDLAVTHNSMTINLDKLDVAHHYVGEMYPDLRPVQTTCGSVGSSRSRWREFGIVRHHGWRARWLRYSVQGERARRRLDVPVTFADICHEVDLLPFETNSPLYLLNVDNRGGFAVYASDPLQLTRNGRPVIMRAVQACDLEAQVQDLDRSSLVLITDIGLNELAWMSQWAERDWVIGLQDGVFWVLGGFGPTELPVQWARPNAVPLSLRRRPRWGRSRATALPKKAEPES